MNTFRTALKTLSHPLSLFAIVILLVNDHVLKIVVPSPLTGKLSDFTGLFFFPFLLAGLLGLAGERLGASPRQIAGIVFSLTAFWFAGIKTIPALNTFTAKVAEIFLGHPTFYVLDPTDLMALVVLPFSWSLWQRMEEERHSLLLNPIQAFAFGLAVLGTIASQPCQPELKVQKVTTFEGKLYIQALADHEEIYFYDSIENRSDWQKLDNLPEFVSNTFQENKSFPIKQCVPNDLQTCYRINGNPEIEFSEDGGQTWKTYWRAPTWRGEFYRRWVYTPLLACRKFPDFIPNDLLVLSFGKDDYVVISSLGNQGLLSFQPSRGWEQTAVLNAEPSLAVISIANLEELPNITSNELILWIIMSLIFTIKLNSKMKTHFNLESSKQPLAKDGWKNIGLFFLLSFLSYFLQGITNLIITFLILLYRGVLFRWLPGYVSILLTGLLLVTFFAYLGKRLGKATPKGFPHLWFNLFGFCSSLLLFLTGWLPFAFWAFGWIPFYWLAFLLSFGLAIVVYLKALHTLEKFKIGDSLPE